MTRRQALVTLAWIAAFVVVGAGLAGVIVGRAAMDGLERVDPAFFHWKLDPDDRITPAPRSTSDPGS
jgi:hypothetical protein